MSTVSTGTVRYRAEAGASLLETMVAGALGVVIIGTALQLFVTHHGHFLGQRTQAELQQDIRWGVQLLAAELRLAGALPDQASLSTMATDEVIFRANTNRVSGVLQADAAVGNF